MFLAINRNKIIQILAWNEYYLIQNANGGRRVDRNNVIFIEVSTSKATKS